MIDKILISPNCSVEIEIRVMVKPEVVTHTVIDVMGVRK